MILAASSPSPGSHPNVVFCIYLVLLVLPLVLCLVNIALVIWANVRAKGLEERIAELEAQDRVESEGEERN